MYKVGFFNSGSSHQVIVLKTINSLLIQVLARRRSMNKGNSTSDDDCRSKLSSSLLIILLVAVVPFHLFIMKVLSVNIRFRSARHIIFFGLALSDCLQVFLSALLTTLLNILNLKIPSNGCQIMRNMIIFEATMTFFVSSGALVILSVERYIACFHSYRLHELLPNKRVCKILAAIWICGIICGGLSIIRNEVSSSKIIVFGSRPLQFIYLVITLLVSIVLVVIQTRLFILGRRQLTRIRPIASLRNRTHNVHFRMNQLKIASVASFVVLSYLMCMIPASAVIILDLCTQVSVHSRNRVVVILAMANTAINPFIYGIGMLDTRQAIIRDLRMLKMFLFTKLGLSPN